MTNDTATFVPRARVLTVVGLGLASAVALTGCSFLNEATDDDGESTEVSEGAFDAAADASAGDCLPEEFFGEDESTFAIDCSDPAAFWTITVISDDSGAEATAGDLDDTAPLFEQCGDEVGAYLPGQPRTDWNMIYDQGTGKVDYLFCTEAIDQEDAEGRTPVVPDTGDCFSSDDPDWWTLPCESDLADSTVTGSVEFAIDDWQSADVQAAAEECGGTGYYELVDQFERTSGVVCFE